MSRDNLDEELQKIKDEMSEIKEMLKERQSKPENLHKHDKFVFDGSTEHVDFDSLGNTVEDYVDSVLSGVHDNLSRSMENLSKNFGVKIQARAARDAARGARRAARDIEREFRRHDRKQHRKHRRRHREGREVHYVPLTDEERAEFFDEAPVLVSAVSDSRRLRILKELEVGPRYPADFTQSLDFKGGTLKHHLDNLVDVSFIAQEKVRGRYLITQLGMEALKLCELLFRRSRSIKEADVEEEMVDIDLDADHDDTFRDIDIDIENDDVEEADEVNDV